MTRRTPAAWLPEGRSQLRNAMLLFLGSAVLLHVPFAVVLSTQDVRFQPALFLTEYSKLLGSSVVSVLVAFGWKRYDRAQHRKNAATEAAIALQRLQPAHGQLELLGVFNPLHYDVAASEPLTDRALKQTEHRKLCTVVRALVLDVQTRFQGLSVDVRQHLLALDARVSLLVDALKRHEASPDRTSAESLAAAAAALRAALNEQQAKDGP